MVSRIIEPIEDRTDIAAVAETFRQTGNAVEVGVWRGEFAAHNLKFWKGRYYMVDLWQYRLDGTIDKNMEDKGSWNEVLMDAVNNTNFAKDRLYFMKGDSVMMAENFEDGNFDWIYIDTLHDEINVKKELNAWYPKLRSGGLFSGDDYGDQSERWKEKFGGVAQIYNWNVIKAVKEFCEWKGIQYSVTWMNDKYSTPAWYFIKP